MVIGIVDAIYITGGYDYLRRNNWHENLEYENEKTGVSSDAQSACAANPCG